MLFALRVVAQTIRFRLQWHVVPVMDELDFANDGQPQSSQRKRRKAPNPSFRISKMSRKTAQTQEKTEQPETQMKRRQRKRATEEVDLNDEAAGTSERKYLRWQKIYLQTCWTFQPGLTSRPWSTTQGSPYEPWMKLVVLVIAVYINIYIYYVYNIYCPYIYIYIYHINLINHVFFVAFTFTLNQVLAATAVG